MADASHPSPTGPSGFHRYWQPAADGTGSEFVFAGMIAGRVVWDRSTRTWTAERCNAPPADAGRRNPSCSATGLKTPSAAKEWVEAGWRGLIEARERN